MTKFIQNNFTKVIGFLGERASLFARFTCAFCAKNKKTLVLDISSTKRLYIGIVGDIADTDVEYHHVRYTTDLSLALSIYNKYDVFIIYDDMASDMAYNKYYQLLEMIYVTCDCERYSILKLSAISKVLFERQLSFYCICESSEEEVVMSGANSFLKYGLNGNMSNIYYIPQNDDDRQQSLRLAYGKLDLERFSPETKFLLDNISDYLGTTEKHLGKRLLYGV